MAEFQSRYRGMHPLRTAMLVGVAVLQGCATTPQEKVLRGEGLGATWQVKIAGAGKLDWPAVQAGIQQRVNSVAAELSRWEPTSSLNELNESASPNWQTLPENLFTPLQYALALAADTGGAYDPTVAPLVDVWGFGTHGRRYDPPSQQDISAAKARVGWQQFALDPNAHRARRPPGVVVDLSSMQHGRGADEVTNYLRSLGVTRFLVDVGSEIRASGDSPEGAPWRVAVESPPSETGDGSTDAAAHVVALRDAGIATSGNYRYFFDYNGRRYSHRIDPRTAQPITHPLVSVTVIDPECMHADALATALTILGPDEGFEYARKRDIAALFILRSSGDGLEERMTPKFAAYVD